MSDLPDAVVEAAAVRHRKYVGAIDDVRLYLTCTCSIGHNHTEGANDV